MDPRSIITDAHQSVAVTDMSSDTSFDALELEEVNRDIKEWEGELVSIANRNNPERQRELGGWLREARQIAKAISDDLAKDRNHPKNRSLALAESEDSNIFSQLRDSHQWARGPFSMKSLGLALQQEPIKGRSRKLKGEPFKVAKGASSARIGPQSRRHKGDIESFLSHRINASLDRDRMVLLAGSDRADNSARSQVGSSFHDASLESGYQSEIPVWRYLIAFICISPNMCKLCISRACLKRKDVLLLSEYNDFLKIHRSRVSLVPLTQTKAWADYRTYYPFDEDSMLSGDTKSSTSTGGQTQGSDNSSTA
jgi:hypothetical protein